MCDKEEGECKHFTKKINLHCWVIQHQSKAEYE